MVVHDFAQRSPFQILSKDDQECPADVRRQTSFGTPSSYYYYSSISSSFRIAEDSFCPEAAPKPKLPYLEVHGTY